ncbi:uncharacterized protein LOC112680089 [Sipha flava]|uniref:Uncharacterized protein LOC112680089 n=1 Tax=Sipha flava TaxID=143950 RepID=A0A8B8F5F2_9HEMI|nr:uncharacterized protein LOC112680089 [Sipha flava]
MITKQRLILPRNVEITDLCIGTWNVQSMYRTGTLTTVVSCLERYRLDITAVQEISGGEKHERGVGFIIKDKFLPNVVKFEPIKDKSEEVKNAFYDELDRVCDGLTSGKPKIIIGDFNTKVGRERIYRPTIGINSLHSESNENGNKLISFATARNMVISSTMFPHKSIHKQT